MENEQQTAKPRRKVVIAGGGTAGWMAAIGLATQLRELLDITLIESEAIGTVGVGESTVPPLMAFHKLLGIDERHFMTECAATFKVGIWFENWAQIGDKYLHPFGQYGKRALLCEFHHLWLRSRELGNETPLGEYNLEWMAGQTHRFAVREDPRVNYAYHFDAALYARFLRKLCEQLAVKRVEGKIRQVRLAPTSGDVESLELEDGQVIDGDLFLDCTGFRGLLIEGALHTGYEDWSHWLPCDSAVAFQTQVDTPAPPYTACYAHEAGWRWNIPVQHRVGNGVVFCSRYMSDDEARHKLVSESGGTPVKDPWLIRIKAGRRRKAWNRNVVSLGLASGFVEPLESTSIHMIMSAVMRLLQHFPFDGVKPAVVDKYNDMARAEIEHIRDFVCMHYHLTNREDTPFWRYCKNMAVPDSLRQRMDLFRQDAHVYFNHGELFNIDSWVAVMMGQGIMPQGYHPFARVNDLELQRFLSSYRAQVAQVAEGLPSHADFVRQYCGASEMAWTS
jgi:tryptophan halogenase